MRKILALGKYTMHGEVLGCGNFGRVELATHTLTNIKVAIKIIDTRKLNSSYASKNLYREARILGQIRHPNIVRLYETLKASYLYCLVLEYVPNKDLNSYLKTLPGCRMSEVSSWPIVRQLTTALVFLHHLNIVHRDLKMDNILLDESNKHLRIIDFGLSNTISDGELLKTHCGSPEFAAPELFYDRHDYGSEVDAWSFGVIVYGMLVGSLPFVPGSTEPSKRHALLKMLSRGLTAKHKTDMGHLSVDCRTLLFQLIEPKSELRLGMFKVANHTWITREGRHPLEPHMEQPIDRPLQMKVTEKLATLHDVEFDQMEKRVSEYKYDSLSSEYNLLMDRYSSLRIARKITSPVRRKPVRTQSVVCRPVTRLRNINSPPSRMKAIMESEIKDDTFIGTTHTNLLQHSMLKERKSGTAPRPTITVSGCDVIALGAGPKQDVTCCAAEEQSLCEGGVSNQSMIESDIVLECRHVDAGDSNPIAVDGTTNSTSTTVLGRDESEDSVGVNPLVHHSDTSSENVDMAHSTSRTFLVRTTKLLDNSSSRQHAVNQAMMEDSSETISSTPNEELNIVKAEGQKSRKTRLKDWLKPKTVEFSSS